MAYFFSSSERLGVFTSVGDYDAPSEPEYTITSNYYLAPGILNVGYGATVPVQNYYLTSADIDFYSLGSLTPGIYKLDVDEYNWDFDTFSSGTVSEFGITTNQLFYGVGEVVSYNTFLDVDFTIQETTDVWAYVKGSTFNTAEYSIGYEKTAELQTTNFSATFLNATYSGTLNPGSTITVSLSVIDSNGVPAVIPIAWYWDGVYAELTNENSITITDSHVGKQLSFAAAFYDNAGNFEISNQYQVGLITSSIDDNQPPSISSSPVTSATEDSAYSYTVSASDSDAGDTLTLSATTLPSWLSFNASNKTLTGTPTNAHVGSHNVVIKATDAAGAFVNQSFTITVSNINDTPSISSSPITSATEDSAYSYTVSASDSDAGDTLTLSATTLPSWLSFNASNKTLTGTPTNAHVGSHNVVIKATDAAGAFVNQSFTITVSNTNDAPTIKSEAVTDVMAGDNYTYTLEASDIDLQDVLILASTDLPDWLSFDPNIGLLQGQPDTSTEISNTIKLSATDKAGVRAEQNYVLAIGQNLLGTPEADVITADIGSDIISAKDGNDIIGPGLGADVVNGEAGSDTINLTVDSIWGQDREAWNINSEKKIFYKIPITGKNKFQDVIDGGNDIDTINLSSGSDAFFLHDTFARFHHKLSLTKDSYGKNFTSRVT